jgi:hypothetical protein
MEDEMPPLPDESRPMREPDPDQLRAYIAALRNLLEVGSRPLPTPPAKSNLHAVVTAHDALVDADEAFARDFKWASSRDHRKLWDLRLNIESTVNGMMGRPGYQRYIMADRSVPGRTKHLANYVLWTIESIEQGFIDEFTPPLKFTPEEEILMTLYLQKLGEELDRLTGGGDDV